MPEGDTVWNTARMLERALSGRRLTRSDFRVPQLATTDLAGWTVRESASRGKHLLLRLEDTAGPNNTVGRRNARAHRLTLHSHLRMDGAWRTYEPGSRWAARPAHLVRVVLHTDDAIAVGYHVHELALVPTEQEQSLVGHLGPDLLGPDWDPDEAVRRIAAQPASCIATALLDQRNLAGIGNLYKCEVLFLRGVWPWTPVRDVPDLPGMVALAQRLLEANRGRWTQSTTGILHKGQTSYVYGRRGQPCRRCGTPVQKTEHRGNTEHREKTQRTGTTEPGERVTYWCPTCQPRRVEPVGGA
jgi:endonuclease-8